MTMPAFAGLHSLAPSGDDATPLIDRILFARFMRPDRADQGCTLARVSLNGAELRGATIPPAMTDLVLYVEHLGRLEAVIGEKTLRGVRMLWKLTDAQREKFSQKLRWLAGHQRGHEPEDRQFIRRQMHNAQAVMTLLDGRQVQCDVLDVSMTGAAVTTEITAEVGERVYLGELLCEVTRSVDNLLGLKFLTGHGSDLMNQFMSSGSDELRMGSDPGH